MVCFWTKSMLETKLLRGLWVLMKQALKKFFVSFLNSAERKQFNKNNILNQSDCFSLIWFRVGAPRRVR